MRRPGRGVVRVGAGLREVPAVGAVRLVPVPRGRDQRVGLRVLAEVRADPGGHVAAALDAERAALDEVVLDVDDDQRTDCWGGHGTSGGWWGSGYFGGPDREVGLARRDPVDVRRQRGQHVRGVQPDLVERDLVHDPPAPHRRDLDLVGRARERHGRVVGAEDLVDDEAVGVELAPGGLAPADRDLVGRLLRHRPQRCVRAGPVGHGDQLVDQSRRRMTRAGDQPGAHAVPVDRGVGQCGDHELVEVAGHRDPRRGRAELVEQRPGRGRLLGQVAGVQPDRTQPGPGDLDRGADALLGVVGVDQQRRARALVGHLTGEGLGLARVAEREGVRGRADRRHAVAATGGEVARRGEPGDVRRARRGHRGLLVGAPGAHLDQRSPPRGGDHPRRGAGDRGVVVEHREHEGLQHDALAQRPGDGQHGAAGEVQLALAVGIDVAGEAEVAQVVGRRAVDHALLGEPVDVAGGEAEVLDHRQQSAQPREQAVATTLGQPARERLEDRAVLDAAVLDPRGEHRELVAVGEPGGRERHRRSPLL